MNGLWKSGVERAKNDEYRLEIGSTNIDELVPVDIGQKFLISDKPLEIDGEMLLPAGEVLHNYEKYIEKHGWRFITNVDIANIKMHKGQYMVEHYHEYAKVIYKKTGAYVCFPKEDDERRASEMIKFYYSDTSEPCPGYWLHQRIFSHTDNHYFEGIVFRVPEDKKLCVFLAKDKKRGL